MNGNVKCVENQGINIECMHVKCKSIIIVVWNNFAGIKFHFYQCGSRKRNKKTFKMILYMFAFEST
jgi:hypothetical protein